MTGFSLSDWDEVGDLVEDALDLPPDRRDEHLRARCGADAARLGRARRLLDAAVRARAFLTRPAGDLAADLVAAAVDDGAADPQENVTVPTEIGPYRILRLLGRGGMGDVYLADRADDQFQRQVAVKVVRAGLGDDLVARFRSERQVLASLNHPHIARLYDGGLADRGRPYLVMEYVDGQPIDRHADEAALPVDERLALFLQVAEAVESAHRRLVVHRDLKPANVLVARGGSVKLLDFGVAKLLDRAIPAGETPVTRAGIRVMTPEYASPEQFLGEPTTTATDIYALGVVLYELLTGRRPHEATAGSATTLERDVLEREPDPPSLACLTSSSETPAAERARRRATTVDGLARTLRGDLDTIVLTALRREPDRRYGSVAAFRIDLERYRAGLPISARPATVRYRAAKFVRRHRVGVAAAVLVALTVGVGTTTTLVQARAAAREGRRAEQIRDFLVGVFEISAPDRSRGEAVTARELLDRGSERINRERTEEGTRGPSVASVTSDLAAESRQRGDYEKAEALTREALAIRRARGDPAGLADALNGLGVVLDEAGRAGESVAAFEESLALSRQAYGDEHTKVALTLCNLAKALHGGGQLDAALQTFETCVADRRRLLGDSHPDVGLSLNNMAMVHSDRNEYGAAERLHTEALAIRRATYGDHHRMVAGSLNNLAVIAPRPASGNSSRSGVRSSAPIIRAP